MNRSADTPYPSKHEADRREEQLYYRLLITMFEAGKELSRQYEKYDGDLDWVDWLKETIPKIPHFNDELEAHTAQQSLKRAKEELEKIHALDTGDSSGALAVANAVADCLDQLDKEIKASRLDAEGGK
jgi:hypothetical protein